MGGKPLLVLGDSLCGKPFFTGATLNAHFKLVHHLIEEVDWTDDGQALGCGRFSGHERRYQQEAQRVSSWRKALGGPGTQSTATTTAAVEAGVVPSPPAAAAASPAASVPPAPAAAPASPAALAAVSPPPGRPAAASMAYPSTSSDRDALPKALPPRLLPTSFAKKAVTLKAPLPTMTTLSRTPSLPKIGMGVRAM